MPSVKGINPRTVCSWVLILIGIVVLHRPVLLFSRLLYCGLSLLSCKLFLHPDNFKYVHAESATSLAIPTPPPPNMIPKIIHQIYKTSTVPHKWMEPHTACVTAHPDWKYRLWTDQSGWEFVAYHHPELLKTYESYPYDVQRVDALRYLLLLTYGGFYLDLDVGCRYSLEGLRQYEMVLPETSPVGFSNDVMGAIPGHPLLKAMAKDLPRWNHRYGSRYPTVMFSTGPMFLTLQYSRHSEAARNVSILPHSLYNNGWQGFFAHYEGGSWHGSDAVWIQWLGDHLGQRRKAKV